MPVTALLLVVGVVTTLRVTDAAIAREMGAFSDRELSTPSSIGSLLGNSVGGDVGDVVFLNHVRLWAGLKSHVFIVSGAKGIRMLVVSESGILPAEHTPMTVDIEGKIRRMPSLAILRKDWKLSRDQIRVFGQQQVYIAAEHVKGQEQNAKAD
jgi:hypothetical protein